MRFFRFRDDYPLSETPTYLHCGTLACRNTVFYLKNDKMVCTACSTEYARDDYYMKMAEYMTPHEQISIELEFQSKGVFVHEEPKQW